MTSVFADTFCFLALLNRRDGYHERAVAASRVEGLRLVTIREDATRSLTPEEERRLDSYLRISRALELLKAKARLSLRIATSSP